jgi:anti-anti-sigma factor
MKITESRGFNATVLFVAGAINDSSSPQLQNEIFRASKISPNLTLDFTDVSGINTSGIQVLHTGVRTVASKRGRLTVQGANAAVKSELQNEGLGRLLTT